MPYQQAMQLPKRLVPGAGSGVIADTPAGKTAPVGGAEQEHGRLAVREWEHGSHSISHPRGVPEMASLQLQYQEGGLPSRSMPGGRSLPPPPPPPVPERTQPQQRGRTRSVLWDPARLAANYHSRGWRKDLEHILKVYYKFSVDYFMQEDLSRVKERFFDLFLQHKKEPWRSRRPVHWTLWPTSRTSSTRPLASIWMAWGASPSGSRRGATIMG